MVSHVKTWIEHAEGVCGGRARVRNTRIPVWTLVAYRNLGSSDQELLASYPTLKQVDLEGAWHYYEKHRDEIDQDIADNEAE